MISRETFDRMSDLSSIKDINSFINSLTRLAENLSEEGFEKDEIVDYFTKIIEIEIDNTLEDNCY